MAQAGSATPVVDGTATVGTSTRFARQDHVHPTDTTLSPLAGSSSLTTTGTVTAGTWSSNFGVQTSHRNVLHNGGFNIWQRLVSSSIQASSNTATQVADRWICYSTALTNVTPITATSAFHYVGASVAPSVGVGITSYMAQRIEAANSWHLAGQTVTLSGTFTSNAGNVSASLYYWNGSADDGWSTFAPGTPAGATLISTNSITANGTQRLTTFTIPSGAVYGLQLVISATNTDAAPLTLKDVQLELGSVATPFERRPYGYELALCQRYYERITNATGATVAMFTANGSSTQVSFMLQFLPKRSSSTTINFAGTWYSTGSGLAATANSFTNANVAYTNVSDHSAKIICTVSSTANAAVGVACAAAGYLEIAADL